MGVHEVKTFSTPAGLAMLLPEGFALGPGERLQVSADSDVLTVRRTPSLEEKAERLARFRRMADELLKLPKPPEVQRREPIEFPERPGLY